MRARGRKRSRRFLAGVALKNLGRYTRRTAITAGAIAIGLGLYIWSDAILQGMEAESKINLMNFQTGSARITGPGYWDERDTYPLDNVVANTGQVLEQLDAAGVGAAPRTEFSGELVVRYDPFDEDGSTRMAFAGVDPQRDPTVYRLAEHVVEGEWLEPGGEGILISTWLAGQLGAEIGYPVTVLTRTRDGFHQILDLEIVGFYETPNPEVDRGVAYLPLDLADEYLEMDGAVTGITLDLDETIPGTADLTPVREAVDLDGLELVGFDTLGADLAGVAETQQRVFGLVLLLLALIALVGISNTMLMAVTERRREIGMMRAVGLHDREIREVFAYEASGIAVLGVAGGLLLGSALVWQLVEYGIDLRAILQDVDIGYQVSGIIGGVWRPGVMAAGAIVAVAVAALASRIPLRRMLRETVPDSLRGQKSDTPEGRLSRMIDRIGTGRSGIGSIALRNVFRHARRSVLVVVAIGVAAMTMILLQGLMGGVAEDMKENAFIFTDGEVRVRHEEFDRNEYMNPIHFAVDDYRGVVERLREMDDVRAVSPRIPIAAGAFRDDRQIGVRGLGVDLDLEREYQDLDRWVAEGRLPEPGASEALMGARLAERLEVGVGDHVTFMTQTRTRRSNAFTVDIVGLAAFPAARIEERTFFMPIEQAARYLRMGEAAVEVLVRSESGRSDRLAASVGEMLEAHGPDGAHATTWEETSIIAPLVNFVDIWLWIWYVIFGALAATVIINTTMMAVRERTGEIGTLSALGMQGRQIIRLFFTEAVYLGVAGTVVGVLVGLGIVAGLGVTGLDLSARMDAADFNVSSIIYPTIRAGSVVIIAAFTVALSSLASLIPASGAARLEPVSALRQ